LTGRSPFLIEVCVENTDGLVAAQAAGADRVELCASLLEGGLTPSLGMVELAIDVARIPFHVIVRPRGGDFLYSEIEFRAMRADICALRRLGVAGVVVGCLTPKGAIDEKRMAALVEAAGPLSVTCHRAFDMTADPLLAVEALVRCGVDRVLTSGQNVTAEAGAGVIAQVVGAAAGRLRVIACGGLDAANIARVRAACDPDEMHFAALRPVASAMTFRNPRIAMGGAERAREYLVRVSDEDAIRATIRAARRGRESE
jgi:copper homeostasis protein